MAVGWLVSGTKNYNSKIDVKRKVLKCDSLECVTSVVQRSIYRWQNVNTSKFSASRFSELNT